MHRFLIRTIAATGLSLACFAAGAAETIRQWQFAPQGATLTLADAPAAFAAIDNGDFSGKVSIRL